MRHIFTGNFIGSHESIIISWSRSNFKGFFHSMKLNCFRKFVTFLSLSLSLSFLSFSLFDWNTIQYRLANLIGCALYEIAKSKRSKKRREKNVWNSSLHQVTVCSIYSFNIFYCHFAEIDKQWDRQNTSQQEMCASFGDLGWDMIKM